MEWNFSNREISIYEILCVIKKIFIKKKYGVTGLVFKIGATNGKK